MTGWLLVALANGLALVALATEPVPEATLVAIAILSGVSLAAALHHLRKGIT